LNVYAEDVDAFDEEMRHEVTSLAAHSAVAVAASQQIEGLTLAVDRRTTIGVAIGILMARYNLSREIALATLKRTSSQRNIKLYDLAEEIVAARGMPPTGPLRA
jgi:AmiR/NasT family two-component response regulator